MKTYHIIIILLFFSLNSMAEGIMTSQNEDYPGLFLKNKSTEISVTINGLIAETIVRQEFENEWNEDVDATYSFPLPLNARVTRLLYSKGDTMVDAILDVMPQTTNPGTGSNENIANLNQYLGLNALRMKLTNIQANGVKWVELHYISVLNHVNGNCSYTFPLDIKEFITYPLDYLQVHINVHSDRTITDFDMPSHQDYYTIASTANEVDLAFLKQQVYPATDIVFNYTVQNDLMNIDFYSTKESNNDGYFSLIGRPEVSTSNPNSFPTNIIFLLENSSTMIGNKFNQSKQAIFEALDKLTTEDTFNVVLFNHMVSAWMEQAVIASPSNISLAKNWLSDVYIQGGSSLNAGLTYALYQLQNFTNPTSILAFTDGLTLLDPYEIEMQNTNKTGIFVVAIGNKIDRYKLLKISNLNYGFTTFLSENENLSIEMGHIFDKIRYPILKDVNITFQNAEAYDLYPSKFPAIYANSEFIITGRYQNAGPGTINIEGFDIDGQSVFPYQVEFSNFEDSDFSRNLWVKQAIDDIEADILNNGDSSSIVQELINLSLYEKMRCRFTAYVEDTTFNDQVDSIYVSIDPYAGLNESPVIHISEIKAYPNPATTLVNLIFHVENKYTSAEKYIKIYDSTGTLLKCINISHLEGGKHHYSIPVSELCKSRQILFIRIEMAGQTVSNIKVLKM